MIGNIWKIPVSPNPYGNFTSSSRLSAARVVKALIMSSKSQEDSMKSGNVSWRFAPLVLFALTMSMAVPAHAGARCSLALSAGHFAFTDNGTVIGVGPRTAVGVFTLDGAGNLVNGVATSSLNGSVAPETFSGTYTVNADCTGTGAATIYSSGTEILALTFNLSFDNNMKEMRAVFTSATLPDGTVLPTVINLQARKQ